MSDDAGDDAPTEASPGAARLDVFPLAIPGYRILQRLGEGGMGEVYEAEQLQPVRRRVAVKVVKLGMDTKEIVARFESERQALALMDHPAIARIFAAGATERGQPYFAMELVRGVPITAFCDQNSLGLGERLELLASVCDAVQHAHQKGVIHRDLKPSNILVSLQQERPAPKIIDFGVAKATSQRLTEATLVTRLGVVIGTPAYMSPEQAELTGLDIDTRSDVYSLGVVLYELLVGVLPFDPRSLRDASPDELRRRIREEEPPRPSTRLQGLGEASASLARSRRVEPGTLRRLLAGDLDWVVMKALEKDRARRYGSPTELAADLRRYLALQPVAARPPSLAYRARTFARRHTAAVVSAAVLILLAAAYATTAVVQSRRIAREAEARRQVTQFLVDLFDVAAPGSSRGTNVTAREMLDRGSARVRTSLTREPEVRSRLVYTMGLAYSGLGLWEPAAEHLEQAWRHRLETLGPRHPDTLEAQANLGAMRVNQGRLDEAERLLREAADGLEAALGTEARPSLRARGQLAGVYGQRLYEATSASDEERRALFEPARKAYEELVQARSRALGASDVDTADAQYRLADVLNAGGWFAESEPLVRSAISVFERSLGPDHPKTLAGRETWASALFVGGHYDEAAAIYEETLAARRRVLGPDHADVIGSLYNLANVRRAQGRGAEAERLYREALAGSRIVWGASHPRTLKLYEDLAHLALFEGRRKDALDWLRQAVELGYDPARPFEPGSGVGERLAGDAGYQALLLRARAGRP